MATLIQSYEQQYSVLTADITSKIGRLKLGIEENREQLTREIQANFEEANDLLEQLELEARGGGAGSRAAAYRAELRRVRDEFRAASAGAGAAYTDGEETYDEWAAGDQRRQLLDNSERLERSGRALQQGARLALDAERAGAAVLQDLSAQRETIQRSRSRLRETDEQLTRSSRLMNSMMVRALQDRAALAGVLLALAALLGVAVYFAAA